jgi:NADPH:quinone reductase-like Zn-dependent oxidoreductase
VDEGNWSAESEVIPDSQRALRYHERGEALEVLKLEEIPVPELGEGEVLLEMLATAIHPSDMGLINGSYGSLRDLPAIGGREGVGKVVAVGPKTEDKLMGKICSLPESEGTWLEYSAANADELILLPSLVPADQLALAILNPLTAWRLLNDFEYLRPDDWIVQNAANSAVGTSVIQFAKRLGVNVINLVRREELQKPLNELGAKHVLLDDEDSPAAIHDLTNGAGCRLALNSVGGRSAVRLAKSLSSGGVHVTFGAMTSEPIRFPTRNLIFDDIRFVGFWLDKWKRSRDLAALRNAAEEVLQPLAMTEVRHPVDSTFTLDQFSDALRRNAEPRFGKVLFAKK